MGPALRQPCAAGLKEPTRGVEAGPKGELTLELGAAEALRLQDLVARLPHQRARRAARTDRLGGFAQY